MPIADFAAKGQADDYPYGRGTGMVLKVEPLVRASATIQETYPNSYLILLSPQGRTFKQKDVSRLLNRAPNLVFICGHYEGFDERIWNYIDEQISIDEFIAMGGEIPALLITEGSEIETEEYNFNKLNMPSNHPARDMRDTFYLNNNLLLRTHTSNTQIRLMESNPNQELKIISAGKVYRRDEGDKTHTHQFTQLEGFMIGQNVNFSHLKGTLELILKELFGKEHPVRFRPSYFPFTEPSVEVDAGCVACQGQGCSICKQAGWVEY